MVICVDFDGVLHSYTSGYTEKPCDPPVPGALEFIHWLVDSGCDVVILTARIRDGRLYDAGNVRRWLDDHGFPRDIRVTNVKPPASLYIDDRGWRFDGKFEPVIEFLKASAFRPGTWNEAGWRLSEKEKTEWNSKGDK